MIDILNTAIKFFCEYTFLYMLVVIKIIYVKKIKSNFIPIGDKSNKVRMTSL